MFLGKGEFKYVWQNFLHLAKYNHGKGIYTIPAKIDQIEFANELNGAINDEYANLLIYKINNISQNVLNKIAYYFYYKQLNVNPKPFIPDKKAQEIIVVRDYLRRLFYQLVNDYNNTHSRIKGEFSKLEADRFVYELGLGINDIYEGVLTFSKSVMDIVISNYFLTETHTIYTILVPSDKFNFYEVLADVSYFMYGMFENAGVMYFRLLKENADMIIWYVGLDVKHQNLPPEARR